MTEFFGEQNGCVSVNSAAGNKGSAGAVYRALGREPGDPVPKAELMELMFKETGECPPLGETVFGQVAIRRYAAAQLAAMTRHEYTDVAVREMLRNFAFIKHVKSMAWTCAGSLDIGIQRYLGERDPRGGVRTRSDQSSGSIGTIRERRER